MTWLSRHKDGRHFPVGGKAHLPPKHFTKRNPTPSGSGKSSHEVMVEELDKYSFRKINDAAKLLKLTPTELGIGTVSLGLSKDLEVAGGTIEGGDPTIIFNKAFIRSHPKEVIAVVLSHELSHMKHGHTWIGDHYKVRGKKKKIDIEREKTAWRFARENTKGVEDITINPDGTAVVTVKKGKKLIAYAV